jgi:hypothetical protein
MYVIIEYVSADDILGLVVDQKTCDVRTWKRESAAKKWARENCSFNFRIVKL